LPASPEQVAQTVEIDAPGTALVEEGEGFLEVCALRLVRHGHMLAFFTCALSSRRGAGFVLSAGVWESAVMWWVCLCAWVWLLTSRRVRFAGRNPILLGRERAECRVFGCVKGRTHHLVFQIGGICEENYGTVEIGTKQL